MSYINNSYYKPGDWNALCDVCGFRHKASELKKNWAGLMVCPEDYELDHPQKYLRVHETGQAVPWVRDEIDVFQTICYIYATAAYSGLGEADCMQADLASPSFAFLSSLKNAGPDQ